MSPASKRAPKLIIVSNRLPFSVSVSRGVPRYGETTGGLVTGLSSFLEGIGTRDSPLREYLWIGWPGSTLPEAVHERVTAEVRATHRSVPVFLTEREMDHFYHDFCNRTIWPLFHYFPSFAAYHRDAWETYRRVNARFCEVVAEAAAPGDIVWIHDYHLLLLPALLRARVPDVSIGFFLHIPFPSFEIFRLFPREWRREILAGVMGADLVGFHTYDYTQHFLQCALRILDRQHELGLVMMPTHIVKTETFPMGVDFEKFQALAREPATRAESAELRRSLQDRTVILSVDRLDYSKGILQRIEGFDTLLETRAELRGRIVLVMVVVPSRVAVDRYERMKQQIEEAVGKINGKYGRVGWTPVVYQYRYVPTRQLASLYAIGDVGLVTPLRDGMNLVAKEYVASRIDGTGVLIVSEMAGAAKELGEAIVINPNNREEIAEAMYEAVAMPVEEQRRRNAVMQARLGRYTVHRWASDFIAQLAEMTLVRRRYLAKLLAASDARDMVADRVRSATALFLLDYDGTLVPFVTQPQRASPPDRVRAVLDRLAAPSGTDVVVISGRDRVTLEEWFGALPLHLVAEHGTWMRERGRDWRRVREHRTEWKASILPMLESYADRLPNSFIEQKDTALVWHFRAADPEQSEVLVGDLATHLVSFTASSDIHVLRGNKVLEVRSGGTNKGTAVRRWLRRMSYDFVFAAGDDVTDEDMFRALPPDAYSIKVGITSSRARFNLRDPDEVLALLERLAARRKS